MTTALDAEAEFDQERDQLVRQLSGMVFSWDQNGHLMLRSSDVSVLVATTELLKRAKLRL